jgi:hypothetical protein
MYLLASRLNLWFEVEAGEGLGVVLDRLTIPFLQIVGGFALGALALGIVSSLVQTRGAIGWRVLVETRKRERSRERSFLPILGILLAAGLAPCLFYLLVPRLLDCIRAVERSSAIFVVLGSLCKLVVVAAVVLAILAWIVTRVTFLFAHRVRTDRERD